MWQRVQKSVGVYAKINTNSPWAYRRNPLSNSKRIRQPNQKGDVFLPQSCQYGCQNWSRNTPKTEGILAKSDTDAT